MKKDPLNVTIFRFNQISAFLDKYLTPGERERMFYDLYYIPIIWLIEDEKPVSRSTTLYRWLDGYQKNPVIEFIKPNYEVKL